MVALMTDLLEPGAEDRVLEVGTGLGYQTAVLAELAKEVWTVEIVEELGIEAEKRLRRLGYNNVTVRVGATTSWSAMAKAGYAPLRVQQKAQFTISGAGLARQPWPAHSASTG
jgi:protein-L-isoaspartate O-methyltransferase